jgi:hypothetical protein
MLTNISAIIALIISIGTLIYMAAFWKRGVEDDIGQIKKDVAEMKGDLKIHNLSSFCMMVQTLWDVYVVDPLHKRPDIATSHSKLRLTQKGLDYIPEDVKAQLDKIKISAEDRVNITSGYLVVQVLGLDGITKLASEKDLSIQEMIATLSLYLESRLAV